MTDTYAITPYGETVAHTGPTNNPFTFQGALGVMEEGSTGLYYMRARYYDSVTARFLSRDPAPSLTPGGMNPYQFALGDPIQDADPSGLQPLVSQNQTLTSIAKGSTGTLHPTADYLDIDNLVTEDANLTSIANGDTGTLHPTPAIGRLTITNCGLLTVPTNLPLITTPLTNLIFKSPILQAPSQQDLQLQYEDLTARGIVPIHGWVSLYGEGGAAFWQTSGKDVQRRIGIQITNGMTSTFARTTLYNFSGASPVVGGGFDFRLDKGLRAGVQLEHFLAKDGALDEQNNELEFRMTYRFGSLGRRP